MRQRRCRRSFRTACRQPLPPAQALCLSPPVSRTPMCALSQFSQPESLPHLILHRIALQRKAAMPGPAPGRMLTRVAAAAVAAAVMRMDTTLAPPLSTQVNMRMMMQQRWLHCWKGRQQASVLVGRNLACQLASLARQRLICCRSCCCACACCCLGTHTHACMQAAPLTWPTPCAASTAEATRHTKTSRGAGRWRRSREASRCVWTGCRETPLPAPADAGVCANCSVV